MTVTGADVRSAANSVVDLLTPVIDAAAWDRPAGALTWSCHRTLAHMPDCLYWYAANLARRSIRSVGSPDIATEAVTELVDMITSSAELLAIAVEAADEAARGWHPAGIADRSGFAAMGCDELLVHAYDVAVGLGLTYAPPPDVAARVTRRLFPWAPDDAEAWPALLWANGRSPLGDTPAPGEEWVWHCAPLAEWNGTIPSWSG